MDFKMKKLINIILIILLAIMELTTITYLTLKITISKNNIDKIINATTNNISNNKEITNELTDKIHQQTSIDKKVIESTLNSKTAQNVLSDITNNVIDYKLGKSDKMTKEELNELAENNIDKVIDESGYNISDKEKENILNNIKNNGNYIIESIYGE